MDAGDVRRVRNQHAPSTIQAQPRPAGAAPVVACRAGVAHRAAEAGLVAPEIRVARSGTYESTRSCTRVSLRGPDRRPQLQLEFRPLASQESRQFRQRGGPVWSERRAIT